MKKRDQRPIQWDIVAVWGLGILISVLFWAGIIYLIWG